MIKFKILLDFNGSCVCAYLPDIILHRPHRYGYGVLARRLIGQIDRCVNLRVL